MRITKFLFICVSHRSFCFYHFIEGSSTMLYIKLINYNRQFTIVTYNRKVEAGESVNSTDLTSKVVL